MINCTSGELNLLVGTYTTGSLSKGIYHISLNLSTLKSQLLDTLMVNNPSFVAVRGNMAYALSECGTNSQLHSIALDGNKLALTSTVDDQGDDPCHINVQGNKIYIANYTSGSVVVKNINANGTLGKNAQVHTFSGSGPTPRQLSSHIHNIALTPQGNYLAASDLGGDCVYLFRINNDGLLTHVDTLATTPGSGPRHMQFSNNGKTLYLITELSDEVVVAQHNNGKLKFLQAITAARTMGHGAGDLHIHPSGHFVYATVRLIDDGIALFKVNKDSSLTRTAFYSTGKHPRNFAITPCGTLLLCACRDKNAIEIYRINRNDGTLTYLPQYDITIPSPVCIALQ